MWRMTFVNVLLTCLKIVGCSDDRCAETAGVSQSSKCLSHKHKDLNLIPGANFKNKTNKQITDVIVCGCNPHAGEAETVESLRFTGQAA